MKNYTKEQESIRQAFANFLGSLIVNSQFKDEGAKENAIALLCEELTKYVNDEDNGIDINSAKPILKSTSWILKKRKEQMINELEKINIDISPNKYTKDIDELIDKLDIYIEKI